MASRRWPLRCSAAGSGSCILQSTLALAAQHVSDGAGESAQPCPRACARAIATPSHSRARSPPVFGQLLVRTARSMAASHGLGCAVMALAGRPSARIAVSVAADTLSEIGNVNDQARSNLLARLERRRLSPRSACRFAIERVAWRLVSAVHHRDELCFGCHQRHLAARLAARSRRLGRKSADARLGARPRR